MAVDARGARRRFQFLKHELVSLVGIGVAAMVPVVGLLIFSSSPAFASPSVGCSASGGTLTITVTGGASSDKLVISTVSGSYQIVLDSTPECTNTTYPESSDPVTAVAESPAGVPTFFQPGESSGLTFIGASGL